MRQNDQFTTRQNNISHQSPMSLARRVMMLLAILLVGGNAAWGQTVTGKTITKYVAADDGATKGNDYSANFQSEIVAAFTELGEEALDASNCFIRWDVKNNNGGYIPLAQHYAQAGQIQLGGTGNGIYHDDSGERVYLYKSDSWQGDPITTGLNVNLIFGNGVYQLGTVVECYVTNNSKKSVGDPDSYVVKYELIFNEDGQAPDDFFGTYSGSDPVATTIEMAINATSKEVTVAVPDGMKYARFVLVKDGDVQTNSSSAISITGGQSSAERPKRGVYVYNSEGLGSSIDVTVSLDAGTFEDYQLVAYFSDEAPTWYGTTITKEPATLDEKKIYSFSYPVTTIDKYIAWNTNTTTIDLASYLSTDLPALTNSSTTGYIGWSVYDGPYGTGNPVNIQGNHWNPSAAPAWAMNFNQNPTQTVWSVSDGSISGSWNAYTNVPVYAPGSDNFENYPNHIVVAEVSDVSSEKIRVRYIFHFTADGQPPYELVNETDIAANKIVVPFTEYKAANKVFDVSDALVSGAKYARIYLEKYGNANAQSGNLTITYNGNPITQCTGYEKYGWYLSETDGIDLTKLSVTGIDADEMMKYNLVIVSSTNPLSGDQEPAWEKKTVYSLQREIKNRINASETETGTGAINIQSDILSRLDATVADFSKSLYAKWYVESPSGDKQSIVGGSGANNETKWSANLMDSGLGTWLDDANVLKFYTDQSGNPKSSSHQIEQGDYSGGDAWTLQIAKAGGFYVPQNTHTSDFVGYKIVFEFSDDYNTSTNGADPGYRLRYVWTIVDPSAFTGELNTGGETDSKTQTVTDRAATSVDVDLTTGAFAHTKLSGGVKYARFYLTDTEGNLVDPDGKLTVSYSSGTVTNCTKTEQGFYIYDGPSGGDIAVLNLSNISVQLTTPKAYKLYKVVGVFSTEMAEVVPEDGAIPLGREPDWDLKYTYSFVYPAPTTKEIEKDMEWRRRGMTADASTTDPENDWGTSWAELSVGQCVKWYVVDGNGDVQPLAIGDGRQAGTWTIDLPSPFAKDGNTAVTTGQTAVNATKWNNTWGKPTIYAPTGKDYGGPQGVGDYKIICEIAADADASATPHARYTFSLVKSFFGELKDKGIEDGETIILVDRTTTSETIDLGKVLTKMDELDGPGPDANAKYARVWLTDASGAMVNPTGLLSVTGMSTFDEHPEYGYYVSAAGGPGNSISLNDATLNLPAGQFSNYQVHVCLSKDPLGPAHDHEPDYDVLYTFGFEYPIKTKYKTLIYDESTRKTNQTQLFKNYYEVTADCNVGFTDLVEHGYVRWYLEKTDGTKIQMDDFGTAVGYTDDGINGWYRYQFNGLTFNNNYPVLDPVVTLPEGVDYKDVRLVCVVTTKDGDIDLPDKEPSEMQVKYVYTLRTVDDLPQSFVHYQGESYKFLMEQGKTDLADERDYITVGGSAGITEKTWDYETNDVSATDPGNVRQNVHQVDYHVYVKEGTTDLLMLPFKDFVGRLSEAYYGPGSDTEPTAFLRWYDWNTDAKSDYLTASGSENRLVEEDWGHMALMMDFKPTHKQVGVTFTAPASFTDEITIACDVSRYTDGFDDSFTYLLHEPTLSMRYVFHIHPASEIANDINSKAESLEAVEASLREHTTTELYEYNGKTVISLNGGDNDGKNSKFSLRANLSAGLVQNGEDADVSELKYYWVLDDSNNPVSCTQMQWYAYFDDGETVWKKAVSMGDYSNRRLGIYTTGDLSGDYISLTDNTTTLPVDIKPGSKIHLVGCIGNGSVEKPVIWSDLEFINEPPKLFGSEPEERTAEYLAREYNHANTLNFDNFFDSEKMTSMPTNSYENYAEVPIIFNDAQYGFCYPQLYGQDATNWWLRYGGGGWYGYGIAPLHADYTLLKSMNMQGISVTRATDDNPEVPVNTQSMYTLWYNRNELYDITHAYDNSKYGTFLYVDAADEARTIASLEFDASLCANSEIYFTAYIADMTDRVTKPQVMFRVYTYDTYTGKKESDTDKKIPVVSFQTGDINSEGAAAGAWYQVHGYTDIPSTLNTYINGNSRHFYVDIDNFSEDTNGADYCVDQISFYTTTAKVKVSQVGTICDEGNGVEVKVIANADNLISSIRSMGDEDGVYLYYRIFKKHSNMSQALSNDEALDGAGGVYEDGSNIDWRKVYVPKSYDESQLSAEVPAGQTSGFYRGSDDGVVYFQFDDKMYPLEADNTYFVSFFMLGENPSSSQVLNDWGNPYGNNVCSVYSNDFTPSFLKIDLVSNGVSSDGNIGLGCGQDELPMNFDLNVKFPTKNVDNPYETITEVTFDFYLGSKAEFKAITDEGGTLYLEMALDHFRANYPDFDGTGELPPAPATNESGIEFTEEMRTLIAQHWDNGNGLLQLKASTQFDYTFKKEQSGEIQFAAIPVTKDIGEDRYICSLLELDFNVDPSASAPKIELGFGDVTYPSGYKRVVRVGIEQLNAMKNGAKLHIPVSNYQNYGSTDKGNQLLFSTAILKVSETNDPTVDKENAVFAKIIDPSGSEGVYVGLNRMYLPLDFTDCNIDFHEGFYYEVSTSFYDKEDPNAETNPCMDDLYLVFKIVPEFVTWESQETGNSENEYSGNWYNDENWKRSTCAELYKADGQNSPSSGHPAENLYEDYTDNNAEINALLTARPGYIPMKFTYVTMMGNNHPPFLFREEFPEAPKEEGSVQTGGQLISRENQMGTDTSPSGGTSDPTTNIRFDMLVRYGSGDDGQGCKGHPTWNSGSGSWDDGDMTGLDNTAFDVEKFYGNICKEIYFKPGSELRMQQRLTYEKAWVEKELEPNKWYLMSAPLKGTYAGDMYVPTKMDDLSMAPPVEKPGRQMTEAFQPISFSTIAKDATATETSQPAYSRTKYPIYQRSWGQTAKVYTKTDDVRATDYSAKLNFSSVTENLVEWGHTYNDVQVPYTGYSGFAIRANKKEQTDNALIRLPKADTQYDYYQWDNTSPDAGKVTQTVTKGETVYGRLVYDNQGGGFTSDDLEQWSIPLANLQAQGTDGEGYTYYLVGNPFMASIDMGLFFGYKYRDTYNSFNPKLDPVYYTYEAGTVTAVDARVTAGLIRPLQAFIVKCRADDAPASIVFNRLAITDGNYTPPTLYVPDGSGSNGARVVTRGFTLKASNGSGASSATVDLSDEASADYVNGEDVTTLFDSNLSDVPMVFTVAGDKAVSIDRRPALDVVPFGVSCASSDEPVEVTVDSGQRTVDSGQLYVLDAVTGSVTEVGMEKTLAVQPNDYGRYFLTTNKDITGIRETLAEEGVVVSVRDRVLTVRSATKLKSVRVMNATGTIVADVRDGGLETTIHLAVGGIYIVEVQTAASRKTVKIVVR